MSTSNSNDLNKPKEPITKRIARAVVTALVGNNSGTSKASTSEPLKQEPQPVQAEAPKAPEAPVEEKKADDQPIYGRRSTRPFIPNPLGG